MGKGNKQLGRPSENIELRKLRSQVWYWSVKSKEGLSDYELDKRFAFGPNPIARSSGTRIKAFEAIRVNASIPMKGTSNKRGFDLVAFVDSHPKYSGTAQILYSPFWKIMDSNVLNLRDIREIVTECVRILELETQTGQYPNEGKYQLSDLVVAEPEMSLNDYYQHQFAIYDQAMDTYMSAAFPYGNHNNLELLTILCAFVFESVLAGNMQLAGNNYLYFKSFLNDYCQQKSIQIVGNNLFDFAIKRVESILKSDGLMGLPTYKSVFAKSPNVNLQSPMLGMLKQIDKVLWRASEEEFIYYDMWGNKIL